MRGAALHNFPEVHHRQPVAHGERLFLIVRDVHKRDADLSLQRDQLELELLAQLGIEGTERLIEE